MIPKAALLTGTAAVSGFLTASGAWEWAVTVVIFVVFAWRNGQVMPRDTLDDLLWRVIVLELIEMGYEPDEAGKYAEEMVKNEPSLRTCPVLKALKKLS